MLKSDFQLYQFKYQLKHFLELILEMCPLTPRFKHKSVKKKKIKFLPIPAEACGWDKVVIFHSR